MAVDMIARMMAMGNGGGSGDAYTKAETDALLDGKADLIDGKVPASQLPSYVDDVLEYSSTSAFPETGENGKIYVATGTNKTYRWGGSTYVEISESLALGETASTAYAGNKGKANADAIAAIKDGTNIDSFADVETALALKADKANTYTKSEVDTALSGKANTSALGAAASKGFDTTPTSGNTNNAVSSDGVYQKLSQKAGLDVVEHYSLSSSKPVVMDASRYSMFFVFGLAQGSGRFTAMLSVNIDDTVSWTMYGNSAQPSNITISYDNATHKLTMQSSHSNESKITVVKCIV